jgi:hypothetical protein
MIIGIIIIILIIFILNIIFSDNKEKFEDIAVDTKDQKIVSQNIVSQNIVSQNNALEKPTNKFVNAIGGKIIKTPNYKYHIYTKSDIIYFIKGGNIEYLIIGGGGAGGDNHGGGGGAGELIYGNTIINDESEYEIIVGSEGKDQFKNGNSSSVFNIIAKGGGGGGGQINGKSTVGGSGGGGSGYILNQDSSIINGSAVSQIIQKDELEISSKTIPFAVMPSGFITSNPVSYTFSFDCYIESLAPSWRNIFNNGLNDSNGRVPAVFITGNDYGSANCIHIVHGANEDKNLNIVSKFKAPLKEWFNITFTVDKNKLSTYFNGIEDNSVTGTFNWGTTPPNNWKWNQYIDEYKPNIYGSVKVKNVNFINLPLVGDVNKVSLKNSGGNGIINVNIAGGGGGGGGSGYKGDSAPIGGDVNSKGGAGGTGTNIFKSWFSDIANDMPIEWINATKNTYIAAGGSGGSWGEEIILGGLGGGGNGGTNNGKYTSEPIKPTSGVEFTGSGGGGGGSGGQLGASGGSGLVIIRYNIENIKFSLPNIYLPLTENLINIGTDKDLTKINGIIPIVTFFNKPCAYFTNSLDTYLSIPFLNNNYKNITFGYWMCPIDNEYYTTASIANTQMNDTPSFQADISSGNTVHMYGQMSEYWTVRATHNFDYTNKWTHITYTISQVEPYLCQLFVNGKLVNSVNGKGSFGNIPNIFIVGRSGDQGRAYNGYVRHFFAYNKILSDNEILIIHNNTNFEELNQKKIDQSLNPVPKVIDNFANLWLSADDKSNIIIENKNIIWIDKTKNGNATISFDGVKYDSKKGLFLPANTTNFVLPKYYFDSLSETFFAVISTSKSISTSKFGIFLLGFNNQANLSTYAGRNIGLTQNSISIGQRNNGRGILATSPTDFPIDSLLFISISINYTKLNVNSTASDLTQNIIIRVNGNTLPLTSTLSKDFPQFNQPNIKSNSCVNSLFTNGDGEYKTNMDVNIYELIGFNNYALEMNELVNVEKYLTNKWINEEYIIDKLSKNTKDLFLNSGKKLSAGAFATILLYTKYKGPIFNIKRSTDNVSMDFYSDYYGKIGNEYLGTGIPLNIFLNGAIAYVTIWYDQTGNNNNAIQNNKDFQPIFDLTENYIIFPQNSFFNLPDGTHPFGDSEYTYTFKCSINNEVGGIFGGGSMGSGNQVNAFRRNGNGYHHYWWGIDLPAPVGYSDNTIITTKYSKKTNKRYIYKNGNLVANNDSRNRQQTNNNNFIGKTGFDGNRECMNGTLSYIYIIPSEISDSDVKILESTLDHLPKYFNNLTSIPELNLWLDAKDVDSFNLLANSNNLTLWKDKSNFGNNAVCENNSTISLNKFNSLYSSVYFAPSSQLLKIPKLVLNNFPLTFFVVFNFSGGFSIRDTNILLGSNTGQQNLQVFQNFISNNYQINVGTSGGDNNCYFTTKILPNNLCLLTLQLVSAPNDYILNINGERSIETFKFDHLPQGKAEIGQIIQAKLGMYLSEMILYKSKLSLNECNKIEGYLASKWGIKLPEKHPYYNTIPIEKQTKIINKYIIDELSSYSKNSLLNFGSACAFGVKVLLSNYDGPIFRIRKNNTFVDFYADEKGNIGTLKFGEGTTLINWLNGAEARIVIWYDQTGNLNHATQTDNNAQPIYDLTNKCLIFPQNCFFNLPKGAFPFGDSEYTYTFKCSIGNERGGVFGGGSMTYNQVNAFRREINGYHHYWYNVDLPAPVGYSDDTIITTQYSKSTNKRYIYKNGILVASNDSKNRQQTNINNYIGKTGFDGNRECMNGKLYYIYILPICVSYDDRTNLEST